MVTGLLFQDMGKEEHVVDEKRVNEAMKNLTAKLEKKAAKLRTKLESENLSLKNRKHLITKLHVTEAQIKHGYKGDLTH